MGIAGVIQAAVCCIACGSLVWFAAKRGTAHTLYLRLLSLAILVYCIGCYVEGVSTGGEALASTAFSVQFSAFLFIPVLSFLTLRALFSRPELPRGVLVALFALSVLNAAALLGITAFGGTLSGSGALYYACVVASLLFCGAGVIAVLRYRRMRGSVASPRLLLLLALMVLPVVSFSLRNVLTQLLTFDPTSLLLLVSELGLGIHFSKVTTSDYLPAIREQVLDDLDEALLFFDRDNRFVYANAAAAQLFPDVARMAVGAPAAHIESFPLPLLQSQLQSYEFTLYQTGKTRHLRAGRRVYQRGKSPVYTSVSIADITNQSLLLQELNALSTKDALTRLYNRDTFLRFAQRDINLALRLRIPAAMLVLDLDDFRRLNERYGQHCGDSVLEATAELLLSKLRNTDLVGRFGNDEFYIFLPNTTQEGAQSIAEKLGGWVREHPHRCREERLAITACIGVSMLLPETASPADDTALTALLASAEHALLEAKATGRDRIALLHTPEMDPVAQ